MTQEERYNRAIKELTNYKNKIELNSYLIERNNIETEINNIKNEINTIKINNKTSIVEIQKYRNKLLELDEEIKKYSNQEETSEILEIMNQLNDEKNKINEWFNQLDNKKNNGIIEQLKLLNKQEEELKNLVIINSIINKFNKINPTIEEPLNPNNTIELLDIIESKYNTERFNEEEYNSLKEQYIEEQKLVDIMIELAEKKYNNSKNNYDEITKEKEKIINNLTKNEKRNLNNEIKNYERNQNIWKKTLDTIKSLKIDHKFIEKDVVKDSIDTAIENVELEPKEEQITQIKEETIAHLPTDEINVEQDANNISEENEDIEQTKEEITHLSTNETEQIKLSETYKEEISNQGENIVNEESEEEIPNFEKEYNNENNETIDKCIQVNEPKQELLSSESLNNIIHNYGLIVNGDVTINGNITITINNYSNNIEEQENVPEADIQEENTDDKNTLVIDITNDTEAREKIKIANTNVSNIIQAIKNNLILPEDGLNEINKLKENEDEAINEIINNYTEIIEIINIIDDPNKKIELTKLGLGKIKEEEANYLNKEDIKIISKISKDDYNKMIIKLVNIMQYEKTIREINKIINANQKEEIKTK